MPASRRQPGAAKALGEIQKRAANSLEPAIPSRRSIRPVQSKRLVFLSRILGEQAELTAARRPETQTTSDLALAPEDKWPLGFQPGVSARLANDVG